MASQAGHMMVERHALAEPQLLHSRAQLDNRAGGFVAENARRRHGAELDFFNVGRADTAGGHLDQ